LHKLHEQIQSHFNVQNLKVLCQEESLVFSHCAREES